MKYPSFFALCLLSIFLLTGVSPEDFNTVTIENKLGSSRVIDYLFVSAQKSSYWSADILAGPKQIQSGKKLDFFVFYPNQSEFFDFLAIDNTGQVYYLKDIQITDGAKTEISIASQNRSSQRIDDLLLCEIVLKNGLNQNINYFYLSPSDSNAWGFELLGSESYLPPGAEISFLIPLDSQDYTVDLLALDESGANYGKQLSIKQNDEGVFVIIAPSDKKQN